jgi:uncharacterized Tic20 family protein
MFLGAVTFWDSPWVITVMGGALSTVLSVVIPKLISLLGDRKPSSRTKVKSRQAKKVDISNASFYSCLLLFDVALVVFLASHLIFATNKAFFLSFLKAVGMKSQKEALCYFFIALTILSLVFTAIEIVKCWHKKRYTTSGVANFFHYILFSCLFCVVFALFGSMMLAIHPSKVLFVSGVLVVFSMPFFWWVIQALSAYWKGK